MLPKFQIKFQFILKLLFKCKVLVREVREFLWNINVIITIVFSKWLIAGARGM